MVRRYAKQRPREERLRAPSLLGVLGEKSLTRGLKVGNRVNRVNCLSRGKSDLRLVQPTTG